MRIPSRSCVTILSLSLALAAVALAGGCRDADARSQTAAATVIEEASVELRHLSARIPVSVGGDDGSAGVDDLRRRLSDVASRLERIDGAGPGQSAAAALLRSSALLQMGRLDAARLQHLQRRQHLQRSELANLVATGAALARLAASAEQYDPATERTMLDAARQEVSREIAAVRSRIGDLEAPIEALTAENRRKRQNALALTQQERSLRQDAAGRGRLAGFRIFEQAIDVRQQAIELNIQAARNEIQIAELEPERDRAVGEAAAFETLLEAIATADRELASGVDSSRQRAATLRTAVDRIHRDAQPIAEEAAASLRGPIAEAYSRAIESLERALQSAGRATTDSTAATAARIASLNARQTLAAVQMSRLLDARDAVASLGDGVVTDDQSASAAALGRTIRDLRTKQAEVAAELRPIVEQSLSAAMEATAQLGDRRSVDLTRANVTRMLALVDPTAVPMDSGATAPTVPGSPPAMAGPGGGLESPEAVLALLRSIADADPAASIALFDVLRASGAQNRQMVAALRSMNEATMEFTTAFIERFGQAALAENQPTAMTFGDDLRIGDRSDRQATIVGSELDQPIRLVRTAGGWFIDAESVFDPEMTAMLGPMTAMIDTLRPAMERVSADFARRIRAGEFATAEAAAQAFQMSLMSEMMGGADIGAMMQGLMEGLGDAIEGMDEETRRMLEGMTGAPDGK